MLCDMPTPNNLIRRVLVPIDLAHSESGLFDYALALGKQLGAELLFFAVIDSPTTLFLIESHPSEGTARDVGFRAKLAADAKVLLKRMVDRAAKDGIRAMGHAVVAEHLQREVLREAEEREVDLILFGSEEHSVLYRLIIGDTADTIMHRAPCPVLTVKTRSRA